MLSQLAVCNLFFSIDVTFVHTIPCHAMLYYLIYMVDFMRPLTPLLPVVGSAATSAHFLDDIRGDSATALRPTGPFGA